MIILGIDPDKGWALVRDYKIISAGTVKGIAALKKIIADVGSYTRDGQIDLLVRIERPKNKKVFARPGVPFLGMMKIAQNVGMNYEKACELGRFSEGLGLRVEFICPARRKLTAKQVREITDYQGRTSQHCRDAIAIAIQ